MAESPILQNHAEKMLQAARASGADHAEAVLYHSHSRHVELREGVLSESEEENDTSIGLRVFCGASSACVSGNDLNDAALTAMADTAVNMARHVPEDQDSLPADPDQLAVFDAAAVKALDLHDPSDLMSQDALKDWALSAENQGMAHAGITRSDGAAASHAQSESLLVTDAGYHAHYRHSHFSSRLMLIGGTGEAMERDYAYDTSTHIADAKPAGDIADLAAKRTLARLNPKQGKTGQFPVIIDRRVAASFLRHFARAINGQSITRQTSFLTDALGQDIFHPEISIIDDPHRRRGLRSMISDSEGLKTERLTLVENGKLNHFLLDLRSARRLGMPANARARRGLSSPPSPGSSNIFIAAGKHSLKDMIADIQDGFYVTEFMGSQISMTTGDYSRGASGFWIENGQIAFPVSQMTLAGNLKDIFKQMIPADDLELRKAGESPSFLIRKMSCASSS